MTTREAAFRVVHATHDVGDGPVNVECGCAVLWCWTCMTAEGCLHRAPCLAKIDGR